MSVLEGGWLGPVGAVAELVEGGGPFVTWIFVCGVVLFERAHLQPSSRTQAQGGLRQIDAETHSQSG